MASLQKHSAIRLPLIGNYFLAFVTEIVAKASEIDLSFILTIVHMEIRKARCLCILKLFSLLFSSSSIVIRINLLHP